ncbi:MAG: rod shape-determining protein MreC [Elusimicrobiales bacterium]|nr:rod shape-determining protein MreC [Elusimicrobiales bacterium]
MNKKSKYLFYFLFSFSFLLLVLNVNSFVYNIKFLISFIFNPKIAYKNVSNISEVSERVKFVFDCSKQIEDLKREVFILKEKIAIIEPLAEEAKKIKTTLGLSFKGYDGIYASVISYNPYDPYSFFYIDKGKNDGIAIYNPVIFFDYKKNRWRVVGRVNEVYSSYSKVSLISLTDFSFVVMGKKSKGLAVSEGKGKLFYRYVEGEFEENEEIFTADTSYTFPPYIYVGNIEDIKFNPDPLLRQSKISFVNVKDIDYVYVLKWKPHILEEKI